jgi:hypothetical protein
MKTVWVYVNTSKGVGDVGHVKVFANPDAARRNGSTCTIPRA